MREELTKILKGNLTSQQLHQLEKETKRNYLYVLFYQLLIAGLILFTIGGLLP